jgi:hypothetical protein
MVADHAVLAGHTSAGHRPLLGLAVRVVRSSHSSMHCATLHNDMVTFQHVLDAEGANNNHYDDDHGYDTKHNRKNYQIFVNVVVVVLVVVGHL